MEIVKKISRSLLVAVLVVGCASQAADHEGIGDQAYVGRNFAEALVEFQLALRDNDAPVLRLKAAMAALNSRDLGEAASQFLLLADDPDQVMTAADGLERVGRAASSEGNRAALQAALDGLKAVSEGRALGSFARELAAQLGEDPGSAEAIAVLPFAAAAAPDARLQDSLMYIYALVLIRRNACEAAVPLLEGLLRRGRDTSIRQDARSRAAICALGLGRRELSRGLPTAAEGWLLRATTVGPGTYPGRLAKLELGNVRFGRGNYEGARDAFRQVMEASSPLDSLYGEARRAMDRLRGLTTLDTAGTVR